MTVVGAGVTGLSVAYHLAQRGVRRIVVVDRAGVGSGASAIQPGGVRQQWGSRQNCLLARESYEFYTDIGGRLELAVPARLEQGGYVFVALLAETLDRLDGNRVLQNELGIPSVRLTPSEIGDLVPGLDPSGLVGGVFCHQDGYFDRPQAVVAAFATTVRSRGVKLLVGAVTGIDRSGDGWQLSLASGSRLLSSTAVVAAGYDSPALLAPLGVHLPIRKEARHLFYSDPIAERLLEPLIVSPDQQFAAKQMADGCVLASDLSADGDPSEALSTWYARIRGHIGALLPILEFVTFPVHVEGFYDLTPDSQPILGAVPAHRGLYVAAGLSGRGFMMAPAVGRLVADAVLDRRARDELLDSFSLARFEHEALLPEPQVV